MAEGHGNALERFVTEDMNIPHATSIETDFHESDEPGGNNRTLTEIFSNHSPVSPELSMSANPPPNSSVRPARRPMNSRERRLMVLRRAISNILSQILVPQFSLEILRKLSYFVFFTIIYMSKITQN